MKSTLIKKGVVSAHMPRFLKCKIPSFWHGRSGQMAGIFIFIVFISLSVLVDAQDSDYTLSMPDNSVSDKEDLNVFDDYDDIIKEALDKIENSNKERDGKQKIAKDQFVDEKDVVAVDEKKADSMLNSSVSTEIQPDEDVGIDRDVQGKKIDVWLNDAEKAKDSIDTSLDLTTVVPILDMLDVENMDIKDVIKIIAVKSGLRIITDPEVAGTSTVFLSNIDAKDALRIVLDANDLAFYEDNGIIYVMTADRFELEQGFSFSDSVRSEMVQLKYSKAADMIDVLSQMKGPMGRVFANEETNTVVMVDVPEKVEAMMLFIAKIDVAVETKEFQLKNKISEAFITDLEQALTKNVGKIDYNGDLKILKVTDTAIRLEEIGKFIEQLDYENMDITFDIKVIQIILDDEHMDGVDWEAIVSDYKSLDFIRSKGEKAVEQTLSIGTVIDEDFIVLQEALGTVGEIYTLKNDKRIRAVDNEFEFELKLTRVIDSIDDDLDKEKKEQAANSLDASQDQEKIQFYLMSRIKSDKGKDSLDVEIYPETDFSDISSDQINIDGLEPKKQEMFLKRMIKKPFEKVISFSRAITGIGRSKRECLEAQDCDPDEEQKSLIVDCLSGSTIVVGGLFKDISFESQRRIPFLGALPMVGSAFTRQGVRSSKSEVIIFITPKVSVKSE